MSAEIAVAAGPKVAAPPAVRAWRRDRRFFTGMALAAAVAVFVGFAPTYYLKGAFATPGLRPLFHLHGALFTSWIVLLLVQTVLVAARRVDIHRRLGVAGGVLAATMIVVGLTAAIDALRRGRIHPAFVWGGLFLIASQVARLVIGGTAAWLAFAGWLTR